MPKVPSNLKDIRSLVEVVAALRGPGGCPWDLEQTHTSLARFTIEEAHEMVEALEEREALRSGHRAGHGLDGGAKPDSFVDGVGKYAEATRKFKDELGDVLFQVLLHAQLAHEDGAFSFEDVVQNLNEKLVRRHPHVFGDVRVDGTADVFKNWDLIKKAEKAARGEKAALISVPASMPALQRAFAIGEKTNKLKFDWQNPPEVWLKVEEEYQELQEAMDNDVMTEIEHELGDVLFSLAQLARHYGLDPEQVLRTANSRFLGRFEKMIAGYRASLNAGASATPAASADDVMTKFSALSTEEKEKFWQLAKKS